MEAGGAMSERREGAQDGAGWQVREVEAAGQPLRLCWKPGLAHGAPNDPAAELLAERAEVAAGERVLSLGCGPGWEGAAAARRASPGRVWLADVHVAAVEAARRTLAANGIANAEVRVSDGAAELPDVPPADVVLARLPKGKLPALQVIWDAFGALPPGGRFYLAGANDEGIKTYLAHAAALFGDETLLAYRRGCRVGRCVKPERPPELPAAFREPWLDHARYHAFDVQVRGATYAIRSRPGVFCWDRLDEGSRALIDTMEIGPEDRVLDIGCGYGIAGVAAARLAPRGGVWLVDADIRAVRAAERTVAANGLANCRVLLSDGAAAVRGTAFDVVVTNPPFHQGAATEYDVAPRFIREAAAALRPGGRLYLVANRFLPYEACVQAAFGAVRVAYEDRRFKVLLATRAG